MLSSEESLQQSLQRLVAALAEEHRDSSPEVFADALRSALALHIARGRTRARAAGFRSLRHDLGLVPWDQPPSIDLQLRDLSQADVNRALRLADRYTDAWLAKRVAARDNSEATRLLSGCLDTIAITENAQAFTEEREAGATVVQATLIEERATYGILLWKLWDAALDRRTCPLCWRRDGTLRPVGISFPDGEPAHVHPRCRCYAVLLPMPLSFRSDEDVQLAA